MPKKKKNYAFIDSQNLNLGITSLGWKLDFRKFKVYPKEKYNVSKAYLFIGYMPENQGLYKSLQEYGFVLVFKPVLKNKKKKNLFNVLSLSGVFLFMGDLFEFSFQTIHKFNFLFGFSFQENRAFVAIRT